MKIIREHINEKFTEDSDPVKDLGIGQIKIIDDFVQKLPRLWGGGYNRKELLWACADAGKIDYVKYLIDAGWDIHYNDDLALKWAVRKAHYKVVKLLIDAGANVNAEAEFCLKWAVQCEVPNKKENYIKTVKLLLDAGADIHINNEYVLLLAIESNYTKMVKLLLDNGANINKIKYTIQWVAFDGNLDLFKLLLNACTSISNVILQSALESTKNKDIVKLLNDYMKKKANKRKIKESLNEKFEEDSDPIEDLGIGIYVKREFADKNQMYEWLSDNLVPILDPDGKLDDILKDILDMPGKVGSFLGTKYTDKLINFVREYLHVIGETPTHVSPDPFHRFLKRKYPHIKSWQFEGEGKYEDKKEYDIRK
jgi:hypothetical protein